MPVCGVINSNKALQRKLRVKSMRGKLTTLRVFFGENKGYLKTNLWLFSKEKVTLKYF